MDVTYWFHLHSPDASPPTCRANGIITRDLPGAAIIQRILMLKWITGRRKSPTWPNFINHSSRWYVNWARMGVKLPVECMVVVAGCCIIIRICGVWRVRWTVLIVGHGLWLMHGFASIYGTVICFPVIRSIWRKYIRWWKVLRNSLSTFWYATRTRVIWLSLLPTHPRILRAG